MIAPILTGGNLRALREAAAGRTRRELEDLVRAWRECPTAPTDSKEDDAPTPGEVPARA